MLGYRLIKRYPVGEELVEGRGNGVETGRGGREGGGGRGWEEGKYASRA